MAGGGSTVANGVVAVAPTASKGDLGLLSWDSTRAARIGVASAATLAVALWLTWPRRPKASKDHVLVALHRFREECIAIFVDITAAVARSGVPDFIKRSAALTSATAAATGELETGTQTMGTNGHTTRKEDDMTGRLQQAIEQPLVLGAALSEAATRAAVELFPGGMAEDLEAELQRYATDVEVEPVLGEIKAMHQSCLVGRDTTTLSGAATVEFWSQDAALEMLRKLGHAKAQKLQVLFAKADGNVENLANNFGAQALRICAEAEDEVWKQQWPGDHSKRCCFSVALEQLSSKDHRFRERRAAAERELEALMAPAVTPKGRRRPR